MNAFPPPSADDVVDPRRQQPDVVPGAPRHRTAVVAALTSALLVGGIVVGSQFASANSPSLADDAARTDVPTEDQPDDQPDDWDDELSPFDIVDVGPFDEEAWRDFDACLADRLGVDVFVFDGRDDVADEDADDLAQATEVAPEIADDQLREADEACANLLPEGVFDFEGGFDLSEAIDLGDFADLSDGIFEWDGELGEAFEKFAECLTEQLGDDAPFDVGDGDFGGGVVVTGTDGMPSIYDFGDDDGSITITKSGDDVTVSTDGDVTTIDLSFDDNTWAELDAKFEDAHAECGDLLPADVDHFDVFGDGPAETTADAGPQD